MDTNSKPFNGAAEWKYLSDTKPGDDILWWGKLHKVVSNTRLGIFFDLILLDSATNDNKTFIYKKSDDFLVLRLKTEDAEKIPSLV